MVSYSITSVSHAADPGCLAVSPQVTLVINHGGRLPLLSTSPAVTLPAKEITPWPVPNYAVWWQRHTGVSSLPKAMHYATVPSQDSNPQPVNRKSHDLPSTNGATASFLNNELNRNRRRLSRTRSVQPYLSVQYRPTCTVKSRRRSVPSTEVWTLWELSSPQGSSYRCWLAAANFRLSIFLRSQTRCTDIIRSLMALRVLTFESKLLCLNALLLAGADNFGQEINCQRYLMLLYAVYHADQCYSL